MNQHYIYNHVDPKSGDIVYVGLGQTDRAWNSHKTDRKQNHYLWLHEQINQGHTLDEIVRITHKNLTREEAEKIESQGIEQLTPKFNALKNPNHWSKGRTYTKQLAEFAKTLHEMGYGYVRIAFLLGTNSHMLAKRMVKNG